jgi:serine/threonine protein kinase
MDVEGPIKANNGSSSNFSFTQENLRYFLQGLNSNRFANNITRTMFAAMLDALMYLQENGMSHRDIKPENIMLDKDFQIKLIDFGSSTRNKNNVITLEQMQNAPGTLGYKAPEMHENINKDIALQVQR